MAEYGGFIVPEAWRKLILEEIRYKQRFRRPDVLERSLSILLRQIGRINFYFWFTWLRVRRIGHKPKESGFTKFLEYIERR